MSQQPALSLHVLHQFPTKVPLPHLRHLPQQHLQRHIPRRLPPFWYLPQYFQRFFDLAKRGVAFDEAVVENGVGEVGGGTGGMDGSEEGVDGGEVGGFAAEVVGYEDGVEMGGRGDVAGGHVVED